MLKPWLWLTGGILLLTLSEAPVNGADAPKPAETMAPKQVYRANCSFCHTPKPARTLPSLKAWISLLYTSGCPDVSVQLDENKRRAIKAFMEAEFKLPQS
jgi:mono/diheme cytochrome c family protein